MFSRIIAFFFLIVVLYFLAIFVLPDFTDQYGNAAFNAKIRSIKDQSLEFASESDSPTSLADKLINTGKNITTDAQKTLNQVQSGVEKKVEQAQKAAESTQKAYDAINTATKDIQNLTTFTGTQR